MKTLKMIGEDELYTQLGFLLSDACDHSIKVAVFEGTTKQVFKNRYEYTGSLVKQVEDVHEFIDRYNGTKSIISGLKRIDDREYPPVAVREALLNAVVHRDYGLDGSTLVGLFDDRIEILTLGGLVKGISMRDVEFGVSMLRNPGLANLFFRLHWIEAYGTGIAKIRECYEGSGLEMSFEVSDNAFKITLPSKHYLRPVSSHNRVEEETPLYGRENDVYAYVGQHPWVRRQDIEEKFGISQAMAVRHLRTLLDRQLIAKDGQGKRSVYRIK